MAHIHKDYPEGQSNKELRNTIKEYADDIFKSKGNINTVLQLSPLLQLGRDELQSRQGKWYMRFTLIIAGLSFLISIAAVYLAISASSSSSEWETNQLKLIERLIEVTRAQSQAQLSIAESRLSTMKEMERTVRKESERLNASMELVNRNVEILQRNMEKREKPAKHVIHQNSKAQSP